MDSYRSPAGAPEAHGAPVQGLPEPPLQQVPQHAPQSFRAEDYGQHQYSQGHGQQQQQLGLAVGGHPSPLPKAQDVRVQCEAPDCQSLLQVESFRKLL